MIRVIPYEERYREKVRLLCLENAGCTDADETARAICLMINCDCYLDETPEACFVAVEDDDSLIGYILCCPDYDRYEDAFTQTYLPKAAAVSARCYVDTRFLTFRFRMFRDICRAHFFIFVRKDSRGIGAGELLLKTLLNYLKYQRVPGIMLVCDPENERALAFFEKHGFVKQMTTRFGVAMLLRIRLPETGYEQQTSEN